MSTPQHEEIFAAELRALADLEQPALDLEPAVALRGGRVRRRRLVAARSVGALAVLAGLGLGMAQLGDLEGPDTPPATATQGPRPEPSQGPRPMGSSQTVELAPGVIASNLPKETELAGQKVLDLGFTTRFVSEVDGTPTPPMDSVLVPVEDITFAWETEPVSGPHGSGVELKNILEGELLDGTATSWLAKETPQDFATDPQGRGSLVSTIGMPSWSHEQVILGSVPSWLEAPSVVIFSSRGFTLPEDGFSYWLEVPTFRSPTQDERLLFALKITEEQSEFRGDDAEFLVDVVISRSADGAVFVGDQCGPDGVASCAERFGGTFLDAAGLLLESSEPGDVVVQVDRLRTLPEVKLPESWVVRGGRWVLRHLVEDVVVANHFTSETPDAPGGGPDWEAFVVGIEAESGRELWRWEIGDGAHPECGPAHEGTGYESSTLECWWYPEEDVEEYRHSFHDRRTGTLLSEEVRPRLEATAWEQYGSFSDHVVVRGLVIGPDGSSGISATDPTTGALLWHSSEFSRIAGTDGELVYVTSRESQTVTEIVGLSAADGSVVSRTTLRGRDVIDIRPLGRYLFAVHGTDYSSFELGFSLVS